MFISLLLVHDLTQSGRERGGEREKERGKERERERARANEREREKERKKETVKKKERIDSHHLRFLFSSGFPVRFNPFYFYFRALPSSTWQCRRDFEELVP
jgi:hypothetical protein